MRRSPLRVLHVVDSLEPGGMENGIVNIAHILEPRGIEIHVACLSRRGVFSDRLPHPERVMVLGKGDGFTPGAAWRLAGHLDQLCPALVHSHNLGPLIYAGLATFWGRRFPLVHGEHSQLTAAEKSPRRLRQRRWLYRACRAIHTVSHPMRAELLALGFPAEKITAIPNGVDSVHFAPGDRANARAVFGLPADAVVIGIVGRFGPFKRHATLIAAFEILAPEFPAAHLLIAGGGGSEEAPVQALIARSPHRDRIHLAGFQSDPRTCYQALDLLAIPSVNEGHSNVALESLACGIPVFANLGCGHERIITTGVEGVIADLSTVANIAAGLRALLTDPARLIDFGRNGRKKVQTHFAIDSMADAYDRLYRTCVVSPH